MGIPEIVPVNMLKSNTKYCFDTAETGKDIILTKNGKGTVVLVSLQKYSDMIDDIELQKAVIAGEQQLSENKVLSWAAAKEKLLNRITDA